MRSPRTYVPSAHVDGGWGWVVVAATFIIHLICDGVMFTFGIFYVHFLHYYESSKGATSLVMSIFVGVCHGIGPVASAFVNKFGCRFVSMVGTILACAGLLMSLTVPEVEYLYLTTGILGGVGFGFIYLPTVVSVALHFEKKRATAMGVSMAGSGIGIVSFAPFAQWLFEYYSYWKGALLILTGVVMNCLWLSFCYRRFPPPGSSPTDETTVPPQQPRQLASVTTQTNLNSRNSAKSVVRTIIAELPDSRLSAEDPLRRVSRSMDVRSRAASLPVTSATSLAEASSQMAGAADPHLGLCAALSRVLGLALLSHCPFLVFTVATFFHYLGLNSPYVYIFHRAVEKGAAGRDASFLISVMGLTNMLGKMVFGAAADRTRVQKLYIYNACLLVAGVATMLVGLISNYYLLLFYCLVHGMMTGGSFALSSIVLVDLLGITKLSNSYGIFLLVTGVAVAIGAPVPGYLKDITEQYDEGFYFMGGCMVFGCLLMFPIPRAVRIRSPQP